MTAVSQQTRQTSSPNQYHLHGHGISVSYYPGGEGPIVDGRGPVVLTYQDAVRSLAFGADEVRVVDADPDLGAIASVTIVRTVDVGSTTFSLIVPPVVLPRDLTGTVAIEAIGITTIHRILALGIGHPQRATYTSVTLNGTAGVGALPL